MPKSPHILLVSGNCRKARANLVHILDAASLGLIDAEIDKNVVELYGLGLEHYQFANGLAKTVWRQRVSRLYYAAYNINRAIRLATEGSYSTESGEHKKVTDFPSDFPNRSTYENKLGILRDDRNLCDYDHTARDSDLIISPNEAEQLVADLVTDAATYLKARGIRI